MEGYRVDYENANGTSIPHWDTANNIVYVTPTGSEKTVQAALDELYNSKTLTVGISDDGYWVINGEKTERPSRGEKGEDADLSQIHIQDGYWYVGETNTGQRAQGPQGEPGTTVYVGTGGGSAVINKGTFNQAYTYATTPQEIDGKTVDLSNTVFQWLLIETDDNNNTITKMIYHIGNGTFVDALGGRVVGNLSGLNIS